MQRIIVLGLALAFAMFGPAVFHEIPKMLSDRVKLSTPAAASSASPAKGEPGKPAPGSVAASNRPLDSTSQFEGPPVADLAEVLRFDVTPGWIVRRWSRVSSGLGNLELQGYRVPLVTGTREDDLAGSLTYYFNPKQQVQQITFDGTTGDARRLVQFVRTKHGFAQRLANSPGQFFFEVPEPRGEAKSVLKIRPASVLSANQPWQRFDIVLVMERPKEP